jgi:hypothetical protein
VTTKPTTKYTVPPTPTVVTTEPTTKYTVPPTPTVDSYSYGIVSQKYYIYRSLILI